VGGAEDKPRVLEDFSPEEKPEAIANSVREAVDPTESPRVPALYRKELVEVLVKRAVAKCLSSS